MKILVYGAGMIGSIVASQLKKNGQDVTVLARGDHAADLRSFGIVTHPFDGDDYCTVHPPVVETLEPEDEYDVILVIMRRSSHQEILPILAKNPHYKKSSSLVTIWGVEKTSSHNSMPNGLLLASAVRPVNDVEMSSITMSTKKRDCMARSGWVN
jgi:glycerol-3-phosphate dehydrogenase